MFSRVQQKKVKHEVMKALSEVDIMDGMTLNGVFLMGMEVRVKEEERLVELHYYEEATGETWDAIDEVPEGIYAASNQVGLRRLPDEYVQRHFVVVIDEEGKVTAREEN